MKTEGTSPCPPLVLATEMEEMARIVAEKERIREAGERKWKKWSESLPEIRE
ncbi:MAG: hypothetical protein K5686_13380 [Lachnospiraceae bacterium]|nr:hypothetical protein [Lachnospiraceae bacterium]